MKDWRFFIPLVTNWILDMCAYIYFVQGLYSGRIGQTNLDFIIIILCASLQGTSNTCVGHELYHRRNKIWKFFGMVSHLKFLSGHIPIFHNELHHKHTGIVAKDPGFTPRGTSVYSQFVLLGHREKLITLKYDDARLKKRGVHSLWERIIYNRVVHMTTVEVLFVFALYKYLGLKVLIFELCYAQINIMLLTSTNYVEHYGLPRKQLNADKPNEKPVYEP